jgi:hypothetical protein
VNNDLRKIDPMKLPTKFQTLAQVVNTGNTVSNTINVTGLTTTGNVNVDGNISVTSLIDPNNKYLPMVDTNGYFVKSPVYVTNEGKYVISAGEAEFLGNITLGGNTTIISSTSVTIEDRIFGVGANNSATGLDSGFMIEHQDDGTFANVALIHHADEHRFSIGYTQNTFTDNHILYKQHDDGTLLRIELHGNLIVQNNLSVSETGTFDGRVGVKTVSPGYDLDVWGTANVGVLTATTVSAENVKGTVVTGSTLYGTLEGSNTASFSTLYGTIGGSNTASVSDLTASGTVKGAAVTGTTLYGTLEGSNTASVSTLTASGTTQATSTTTGALTVAGGISTQTNVHAANVYISGGLITNTAGVTKKTYSYTGAYESAQTIANATLTITFSQHVFYAKIVAHLIESDDEVSTMSLEVGGGHRTGGTPLTIAKGPQAIFGSASTNPWDSVVSTTATTIALKPTTDLASIGNYNVFIEYISAHADGRVVSIKEGTGTEVTFGY